MNRTDLIAAVADINRLPKSVVGNIINDTFTIIGQRLVNGEKVQILGFGTFHIRGRAGHIGRNPRTGEEIHLPASRYVHFAQGKPFKRALNH